MKAVLFDLDGTLLPMDQEVFVKDYLGRMAAFLTPHGYDPEKLIKAVWIGTGAMVKTDGTARKEDEFWQVFNDMMEKDARQDSALFEEFYRGDFQKARQSCGFQPAAAPAVPVHDTIKLARDRRVTETPDRSMLFAVQTPQVIAAGLLKAALQSALTEHAALTDDCSAVERLGKAVYLTDGDEENLKITPPRDLALAALTLRRRAEA